MGIRAAVTRAEGWWFDVTRRVQTEGLVAVYQVTFTATGETGYDYLPTRPSVVRKIVALLPVPDLAEYTFVDVGSGKGRVLLVAAEYPFRTIRGIEFARELHCQAERNISSYRYAGRRCGDVESIDVESIHGDAMEYVFPDSKLILYLYNPFSPAMMRKFLMKLEKALAQRPRHVVVILVNLESASVVDSMAFLRLYCGTPRFRIYQTVSS